MLCGHAFLILHGQEIKSISFYSRNSWAHIKEFKTAGSILQLIVPIDTVTNLFFCRVYCLGFLTRFGKLVAEEAPVLGRMVF